MEDQAPYGEMMEQFSDVMEDLERRRALVTAETAGAVVDTIRDLEDSNAMTEWKRIITLTGDDDAEVMNLAAAAMSILIERALKKGAGKKS